MTTGDWVALGACLFGYVLFWVACHILASDLGRAFDRWEDALTKEGVMAGKRKAPKKQEPELVWEDGYYWIVAGTKRLNAGRNLRYAERMLAEQTK